MLLEEDRIRLRHMLDAAAEAVAYAAGRTRDDLDSDRQLVHSLVRCIEVIGEAASRMTPAARKEYPDIPWRGVIGMRNRLIHAYFDVNLTIIWRTVTEELPQIVKAVDQALSEPE